MDRRIALRAAFVAMALLGVAACGRSDRVVEAREARKVASDVPPVASVRVEAATRRTIAQTVEPVGTVRTRAQVLLSSKIVAAVVAVHAREGDRVRTGDLLVTLDDRDLRAQLRRANAGLEAARQARDEIEAALRASDRAVETARVQEQLATVTLDRHRTLIERDLIARQLFDEVAARARAATTEVARLEESHAALGARRRQVIAQIEQAEAEVAAATVATGYARIVAPMAGVVVGKSAEAGNLAAPGVTLFVIEDERYRLEATVQESDIRHARLGQRVRLAVDALGGEREGAVSEIVPAADPASRTFVVKIDLPPEPGLRSGLFGRARFIVGQRTALFVPRTAVHERGQLQGVFVVDATGVARLRLVRTGETRDDAVEILSGLSEAERVVTEGVERLADGVAVESRT